MRFRWFARDSRLKAIQDSAREAGRAGLALYAENERLRAEIKFLKRSSEDCVDEYVAVSEVVRIQDDLKREKEKNSVLLAAIRKMEDGHAELMKKLTPEEV